jgi:hypothetical protein
VYVLSQALRLHGKDKKNYIYEQKVIGDVLLYVEPRCGSYLVGIIISIAVHPLRGFILNRAIVNLEP